MNIALTPWRDAALLRPEGPRLAWIDIVIPGNQVVRTLRQKNTA
jgi:hypothetical protein